jgi:hypothetical protein
MKDKAEWFKELIVSAKPGQGSRCLVEQVLTSDERGGFRQATPSVASLQIESADWRDSVYESHEFGCG